MLDVRRLHVLCEVARRGSLSGAAESLRYTPSAVSQQIAALERDTGVTLVERRARGVVLTEAGAVLVQHAEIVLRQLEDAEAALAELSAGRSGALRLASFATAGASIVPGAVDAFAARHPGVEIRVEQATSVDAIARLRQGWLDVVLTVDQDGEPDVAITDLFEDPFTVALHTSHPRAHDPHLTLADLAGERWIDVPRGTLGGDVLSRALTRLGLRWSVAYESDDYTAIHELVGAGLGVALLPDLALFPRNSSVVFRSLGPDAPKRRIQAATRLEPLRSASASAMLEILRSLAPRVRRLTAGDSMPDATDHPATSPAAT